MSLTEEQKEQRLNYITGSDASVICGVNPWGNIIDLWQYKTRLAEAPNIDDNPRIKAGNYLESAIRQWYQDETNKKVDIQKNLIVHPTIPFMAGNVDGLILSDKAVFEAKTASYDTGWGEYGENLVPDHYLLQVAHYVAVTDLERAYIAVLIRGNDFRHYVYERNLKLEELLIKKEKEFWDCVQNEVAPLPRTKEEIMSLYNQAIGGEKITATDDIEKAVSELSLKKSQIKELENEQKELEAKIKIFMQNNDTLIGSSGKPIATWNNSKGAVRFDSKKFAEQNEKLYEEYLTTGKPTRRFVIK